MDILEFFLLALRALRANKIRALLTMLGIIIGVASIILLVSIGTGLQEYITQQFSSLGSNNVFVMPGKVDLKSFNGPPTMNVSKFDPSDATDIVRESSVITDASPAVVQFNVLTYKGETINAETVAAWESYFIMGNFEAQSGDIIRQSDVERSRKVIALGSKAATELFGDAEAVGATVTLGGVRYVVGGVLVSKGGGGALGANIDDRVYIPYTTGVRQFNLSHPLMILTKVKDEKSIDQAILDINRVLLRRLKADDFTVVQQTELLNTINQFLGAITVALGGISAISLLVGGIGIMNIMLVSVTERTREIGLRKAVGAPPHAILLQFLIEAVMLSLLGGAIGILLGALGSLAISSFIHTYVTLWSVGLASGFSALIGIIFGVAPAIRASRLDPIEALRYE